jgi:hypothetical protein
MTDGSSYQFVESDILVYAHDRTVGVKRDRALTLMYEL